MPSMPRPDDRERVEPVRTLRLDGVLPVVARPVPALPLEVLAVAATGALGAVAAGAMPQTTQ
jgi:hypothetical protein